MKFATLFSGCGGADAGLREAGLAHSWGVENNPAYANIAGLNGFEPIVQDVRATDFRELPYVGWLHASPPCTNASTANPKGGETALDIELAYAIARAIRRLRPEHFSLENVRGYGRFESLQIILRALEDDWNVAPAVLDSSDYGVPQSRKRLWLIAGRTRRASLPWPKAGTKASWNEAIMPTEFHGDILSDRMLGKLPVDDFPWHLCSGWEKSRKLTMIPEGRPAMTLTSGMNRPSILPWTVKRERGILTARKLGIRQMAALQGFPPNYVFPESTRSERARSFEAIGNSVCPGQMLAIAEALELNSKILYPLR